MAPKKSVKDAPSIITSIRLEPPVKAAIEKAAKADDRSVSSLIQRILVEWLKERRFLK